MDFIELLKIMIRRWFVVIPVLVVAAVIGSQLVGEPEQLYTATGTELLISADASEAATAAGPLNVSVAGGILASALNQEGYRTSLRDRGLSTQYTVEANPSSTVLTIAINGSDPATVLATGQAIAAEAEELLASVVGGDTGGVRVTVVSTPTEDQIVPFGSTSNLTVAIALLPGAGGGNPFPPSVSTVRTLLEVAQRPSLQQSVAEVAPNASFVVGARDRDSAPIINVTITAAEPAVIFPTYEAVLDALQVELDDLQGLYGVEPGTGTVFSTLSPPSQVVQTSSSEVRVIAGIALLALAVACALAILTDTLIARRRTKRKLAADGDVTLDDE